MSYRGYNTFGSNAYTPTYEQRFGYSNVSKNYSSKSNSHIRLDDNME